ncbi:MAG: hypothetical protein ACYCOO_04030 [Chitinophagaceae bacterium]
MLMIFGLSNFFSAFKKSILILFLFGFGPGHLYAQALLPSITVLHHQGKNTIEWLSGYRDVSKIGVQRSSDSIYNFSTIGYVDQPNRKQNAFIDHHPYPGVNFYHLLIELPSGTYFFSQTVKSTTGIGSNTSSSPPEVFQPQVFQPSRYVYTNADGNVDLSFPNAPLHQYQIRFFDSSGEQIFDLGKIPAPFLVMDKSNFLHSGWFHFALYDGKKLIEKSKFFIPLTSRADSGFRK